MEIDGWDCRGGGADGVVLDAEFQGQDGARVRLGWDAACDVEVELRFRLGGTEDLLGLFAETETLSAVFGVEFAGFEQLGDFASVRGRGWGLDGATWPKLEKQTVFDLVAEDGRCVVGEDFEVVGDVGPDVAASPRRRELVAWQMFPTWTRDDVCLLHAGLDGIWELEFEWPGRCFSH